MIKIMCAACLKEVRLCKCPDDPIDEHYGFTFNRIGEECMRWLRLWGWIR